MEFTAGQDIWVKLPWVDDEMAVDGTFLSETAKRYKVHCPTRGGDIYVAKKNIYPRDRKV
tara:strand:+ start:366 stop:545 length:180 start_codon:yes stop_codon:yes gene_type:complete